MTPCSRLEQPNQTPSSFSILLDTQLPRTVLRRQRPTCNILKTSPIWCLQESELRAKSRSKTPSLRTGNSRPGLWCLSPAVESRSSIRASRFRKGCPRLVRTLLMSTVSDTTLWCQKRRVYSIIGTNTALATLKSSRNSTLRRRKKSLISSAASPQSILQNYQTLEQANPTSWGESLRSMNSRWYQSCPTISRSWQQALPTTVPRSILSSWRNKSSWKYIMRLTRL